MPSRHAHGGRGEPKDHGPAFDPAAPGWSPPASFLAELEAAGIACDEAETARLGRYLRYLHDANERFNLTAVADPESMWSRHIADSLTLLPLIQSIVEGVDDANGQEGQQQGQQEAGPESGDQAPQDSAPVVGPESGRGSAADPADRTWTLLDVGSGGGLPGIPLAIAMPSLSVTLLEATGKKVRFLEAVVAALGLANVQVVQARAEDAGRDRERHRERFDIVVSRAVGALATLVELTVPFARVGGTVLAVKGERAEDEVAEAKQALYALHAHALEPIRTATSTIVPVRKMRITPKIYPRRPGEPKRVPLGLGKAASRDERPERPERPERSDPGRPERSDPGRPERRDPGRPDRRDQQGPNRGDQRGQGRGGQRPSGRSDQRRPGARDQRRPPSGR